MHVIAAGERQRPARKRPRHRAAHETVGAVGADQAPALDGASGGADRPSAVAALDAEGTFGDELSAGRPGRFEQREIQVAPGSDDEGWCAGARGRQFDVHVSASVAEIALADGDSGNRPRRSERPEQIERACAQSAAAGLLAWMAAIDDGDAGTPRCEQAGRPGAGGAATDDRDIKGRHGQAK